MEMKDVKVCHAFVHDPGALHMVSKKVLVPEDLKGTKIRPATSNDRRPRHVIGRHQRPGFGARSRVTCSSAALPTAFTFPWGSIFLFHSRAVVKFHMDLPFYVTPFVTRR